jgi:hypothetical protein
MKTGVNENWGRIIARERGQVGGTGTMRERARRDEGGKKRGKIERAGETESERETTKAGTETVTERKNEAKIESGGETEGVKE